LAREDTGNLFPQGNKSPISPLSVDCPAPESSIYDPERHRERAEELANSSVPSNHDNEHEKATFGAEHALEGQEAARTLLGTSSNLQHDTKFSPDSTRYDDPQVIVWDTPDVHAGDGGEERSGQTDCYEESLEEDTNSALGPASLGEDKQHVVQPRVEDLSDKGDEDDEVERIYGDEEDEEEQTEQGEEEEIASSARSVGGDNDGESEASETPYMEPKLTQDEERLQGDTRGFRAPSSVRLAGGVNVPQRSPRSNGNVVDRRTDDTPSTGVGVPGLTGVSNSSTDDEEDSDDMDPKSNTSNHVRPRAKRVSGASFSIPETPKKRRKTSPYITESTTCSAVNNIPDSLFQPPQVYQLIAGMLDKSYEDDTKPLVSFFFTIGSPFAIRCFRDTCRQVRNVQVSGAFPEETGARRSTRALDHIGMHDKMSPILHRYHLVKLVERLSELQQESSRSLCQQEPKKLKYRLRRQLPPKALVGPKGAASEALKRLLGGAYPEALQTTEMESAWYNQQSKELKNRLSAGRNWHALQAGFGIRILALLPVGKEVGVWNSK
jgi:hypothetical protein